MEFYFHFFYCVVSISEHLELSHSSQLCLCQGWPWCSPSLALTHFFSGYPITWKPSFPLLRTLNFSTPCLPIKSKPGFVLLCSAQHELPWNHRRHKGDSDSDTVPVVGANRDTASSAASNKEWTLSSAAGRGYRSWVSSPGQAGMWRARTQPWLLPSLRIFTPTPRLRWVCALSETLILHLAQLHRHGRLLLLLWQHQGGAL